MIVRGSTSAQCEVRHSHHEPRQCRSVGRPSTVQSSEISPRATAIGFEGAATMRSKSEASGFGTSFELGRHAGSPVLALTLARRWNDVA